MNYVRRSIATTVHEVIHVRVRQRRNNRVRSTPAHTTLCSQLLSAQAMLTSWQHFDIFIIFNHVGPAASCLLLLFILSFLAHVVSCIILPSSSIDRRFAVSRASLTQKYHFLNAITRSPGAFRPTHPTHCRPSQPSLSYGLRAAPNKTSFGSQTCFNCD